MDINLSIITATYNSEKTLEFTLESILNQTFQKPFEYIIVDGNSKDNTLEIIKGYESLFEERNIVFKWISEPDTGIYNAWNKGLKLSEGNYISFIGSDDRYLSNALERYYDEINNNLHCHFYCSKVKVTKDFKPVSSYKIRYCKNGLIKSMPHVGSFHAMSLFKLNGDYNENYKITGDYELLLRLKKDLKVHSFNDYTVEMEVGGVSNNKKFQLQNLNEIKRARIETDSFSKFYANYLFFYDIFRLKCLYVFKLCLGEKVSIKIYKYFKNF
jgi:glycosyltransferase involved in cell wall biosynthesis